jgi:peroxiredoxin
LAAADESAGILPEGSVAPNIVGQSVLDGKTVPFNLKSELSKKIVVLYFFPLAFSAG